MPKNAGTGLYDEKEHRILYKYPARPFGTKSNTRNQSLRIAAIYLIIGCLWILLSDKLVGSFIEDRALMVEINIGKGWFYVISSSLLIYTLVFSLLKRVKEWEGQVIKTNSDLEKIVSERTCQLRESNAELEKINAELEEEIAERKNAEEEVNKLNRELENRVLERTRQLAETVTMLQEVNVMLEETNCVLEETNAALQEEISQRTEAEKSLRESEERYRAMFQNMSNGVSVYQAIDDGSDFVFKDFNASAERINNIEKKDYIGKRLLELLPAMDEFGLMDALRRVYKTGKEEYIPAAYYSDGYREAWTENQIYRLPSGDLVVIFNDVTKQKNAEIELKISEERLRLAMEAASDGIWDWETADGRVYWSARGYTMLGYEPGEFKVDIEKWKSIIHPADVDEIINANYKALNEGIGSSFAVEYRCRTKDGEWKWIISRGKAVEVDENNKVVRIIGTHTDITDRKNMEIELVKAKEQAEAANIAKSQFLANMSHEIRTPMNGIVGMTNLVLETELDDEQKEYLEMLKISSDSLLKVINDVLDYSKIEAGKINIENSPFKLNDAVYEVFSLFNIGAKQKGLAMETVFEQGLPEILIGDRVRLRQVLSNLIGNAIKFTERGTITISIRKLFRNTNTIKLLFSVRDTGIGIPEEKMGLLFGRFNQLDSSYTKLYQGTGLGLAISKKLVEMMQGEIWVESQRNSGSTFYFTIVFAEVSEQDGARPAPEYSERVSATTGQEYIKRILVVDDDDVSRYLIKTCIDEHGIDMIMVDDWESAFNLLGNEMFDMILLDAQMSVSDGISLTRMIRDIEDSGGGRHIPIIGITPCETEGERDKLLAEGMDGYITKPVNLSKLSIMLKSYLSGKTP